MSVRVAFATTEGERVDEHFGHAIYWDVYDIGKEADYVETRRCRPGCSCHDTTVFDAMLKVLDDCEVLFCARIGEAAAQYVIRSGKRVFEASGELNQITQKLAEDHMLERGS